MNEMRVAFSLFTDVSAYIGFHAQTVSCVVYRERNARARERERGLTSPKLGLFCFSGDPIEGDPRSQHKNKFKIGMIDAPYEQPTYFCLGCFCPCYMNYVLRKKALESVQKWPAGFSCCQGYFNGPCCQAGSCGEQSYPELCLCLESCFCASCSLSASRLFLIDTYSRFSFLIRERNAVEILRPCVATAFSVHVTNRRVPSRHPAGPHGRPHHQVRSRH